MDFDAGVDGGRTENRPTVFAGIVLDAVADLDFNDL